MTRPFCKSHKEDIWHIAVNMDADKHGNPVLCCAVVPGSPSVSATIHPSMLMCPKCTVLRPCGKGEHDFFVPANYDEPFKCMKCDLEVHRAVATKLRPVAPSADEAKLRANLIRAGRAVGSFLSDDVSTGFLCGIDSEDGGVGREVELVIERYRLGLRWIALGIVGRQHARPDYEGQPFTDWQLAALLLEGIDIHGLVAPRKA